MLTSLREMDSAQPRPHIGYSVLYTLCCTVNNVFYIVFLLHSPLENQYLNLYFNWKGNISGNIGKVIYQVILERLYIR